MPEKKLWGEATIRLQYDPEKLLGPDEEEAYEAIWEGITDRLEVFVASNEPAGSDLVLELVLW